MSYSLTLDWDAIQERNIDPFSPVDSDNHNKLLKILGNHKMFIKGFDLTYTRDNTTTNSMIAHLDRGTCVLQYMVLDFLEPATIRLFQCPITERRIAIVIEYQFRKTQPLPVATIKSILWSEYDPLRHLLLYSFQIGNWNIVPTLNDWTNHLAVEPNFIDHRYDDDVIPSWAWKTFVKKAGDEMEGYLTLHDVPIADFHATPKIYVDQKDSLYNSRFVLKAGDLMSGYLTLHAHPTLPYHASTKAYVDNKGAEYDARYVPLTRAITAGNGLTGGGTLAADRTITLGNPSDITGTSTNAVTATSHTHKFDVTALATYTVPATSEVTSALRYTGHTKTSACLYGGATNPSNTTRLNYDGYLYATQLYDDATRVVNYNRNIIAGNGLTGGGTLAADRTITLGTPSDITGTSTNAVTATSHTHKFDVTALATYTVPATSEVTSALRYTGHTKTSACLYGGTTAPDGNVRLNYAGDFYATRVLNANYNDYAECFKNDSNEIFYNRIVQIKEDDESIELASSLSTKVVGIISDSYAFLINGTIDDIETKKKVPVAMAGTVNVDADDAFISSACKGDFIVASKHGLAKPITKQEYVENYIGCVVGKIIEIDKIKKQYKVLVLML